MRSRLAIVVALALLLGGVGWSVLRVARLDGDPIRAARELAIEPSPAAPAHGRVAAPEARPALVATSAVAADAAVLARVAALEQRLAALERSEEANRALAADAREALDAFVAERMSAAEAAVIATSRNCISAQAQFQASARCDADGDRAGEYGGFLEMSGATAGRMASALVPPVLASAFRTLTPAGEVVRNGYVYRAFLPNAHGAGVGEPPGGFTAGMADVDLSETTWCLYAWPEVYGKTGTRTFFTNQGGDVLATDCRAYGGSGAGPAPDAAFVDSGSITGRVAIGVPGADGNVWKQVH